jgi:membrane-bound PQQ-dependent dehydrogenase (glucose/quinate/shikimate family)
MSIRSTSAYRYPRPLVLATILLLIGLALLVGGVPLVANGGSFYYALSGVTLLLVGVLMWRADPRAAMLYGLFMLATLVWSLVEAGTDLWALVPRLGLFTALGLWMLLPRVRRGLHQTEPDALLQGNATRLALLGLPILAFYLVYAQFGPAAPAPIAAGSGVITDTSGDWSQYGATMAGTRFSPHQQINAQNVHQLETAWVFRTNVEGTFKGTPIHANDSLYLCTGKNIVIALDAQTGEERWRFDPQLSKEGRIGFWDTCRGLTYFETPADSPSACPQRIFNATTDARLIAINAATGEPCADFGDNGEINLLAGMGETIPGFYYSTSPAAIASGVVVVGGLVVDNVMTQEPSGVVRGFDPISGELLWAWDMGREDRAGLPPQGENYTRGTPNVWAPISADDELGLVYLPTGNATPDYVGSHRTPEMEKYASSIVALNARTGKVAWHFQTTHHDIWDYDVASQPTLTDVPIDGVVRKAVIVPTKRGEVFMLDRATGEPLAEVAEVPTPQTDVPGEWTSPTQPFSVGMQSFYGPVVEEKHMWGITPLDQLWCRNTFRKLRYEGPMTPPSLGGSLFSPGVGGGMNWGSTAVDGVNHLLVVNTMHLPVIVRLLPREEVTEDMQFGLGGQQRGTPYAVFSMPFLSPIFSPCLQPPYGEMAVVDLANQKVLWQRPLGTAREQGPLGIPSKLPLPMGMFYQAGSAVTGGGLIFIGGVIDKTMRAIDLFTGKELWSQPLPENAQATPMSYVSPNGRQTVVITLPANGDLQMGGHGDSGQDDAQKKVDGGYVIAYRLPE